jgi:hypothetical protein
MIAAGVMGGGARHYSNKVKDTQAANLIGYWPLNGSANDISGNGFHGTPSAAVTWGTGVGDGGQAAVFAGDGYIDLFSAALAAALNGEEGTLFSWFQVSEVGIWSDAAYRNVTEFYRDANNEINMFRRSTANQMGLQYKAGATSSALNAVMNPSNPTGWIYGAVTWNKALDRAILYVTGSVPTVRNTLGVWGGAITLALIGASTKVPAQAWKGSIAHVALWNAELSAAQIASFAVTTPPF